MVRSPTKSSTPRLSEVTRHLVLPSGFATTGWPSVEAKCSEWGDEFDRWQADAGRVILGKRADGLYAATVGGITLSIPRQVAKTFLVGRIIFALCVLFPGLRVLWTAHHTATLSNTFRALAGLARRRKVAPYIAHVRRGSGKESIEFVNGSVIFFGARSQGFGRGFEEIDAEVFDEAQILDVKALEDMVAATNQSRHPHGALLFYMCTPPRPNDPGEALTLRRREALEVEAARARGEAVEFDALWVETGADRNIGRPGGPSLDDHGQWRKANPSFPHRTPLASMLRLRRNLPGDDSWRREGMGVWDEYATTKALIPAAQWGGLRVYEAPPGTVGYGVKFSADGSRVALAVAVRPDDDSPVHVEVVRSESMALGTAWLVDWLSTRWRGCLGIAIDGKSGSGQLVNALRAARVPARVIVIPTLDQVISAHAMLLEAVVSDPAGVSHFAQAGLDDAVAGATKRPIGKSGGWGWQPIGDAVDVTPLEAATFAHLVAATNRRKVSSGSGNGRRVVVLT